MVDETPRRGRGKKARRETTVEDDFFAEDDSFSDSRREEEDFEDEEGFDEDLDSLLEESDAVEIEVDEVTRLARVLETIKTRIEWLESLKANTEERVRLSEITGIELTQEALDEIIEAAKSEAKSFSGLCIKLARNISPY